MMRYTRQRSFIMRVLLAALFLGALLFTMGIQPNLVPHARAATNVASNTADFKPDVIYQVVLDRFFDGNSANNDPAGDTGLYDSTKSNWKLYWGGDLAGLTQKIPYLAGMGITALWISPATSIRLIHTWEPGATSIPWSARPTMMALK